MIVTGNSPDEFVEVMGDPCFEVMSSDWMIEQVETVGKMYVGGVETLSPVDIEGRIAKPFRTAAIWLRPFKKTSSGPSHLKLAVAYSL